LNETNKTFDDGSYLAELITFDLCRIDVFRNVYIYLAVWLLNLADDINVIQLCPGFF